MSTPSDGVIRSLEDTTTAQVVNLNPIATFVINDQHIITHWNIACERLTGCKAEDVIGTRKQWHPFYPSERPVMADILLDGARESDVAQYYEGKYRRSKLIEGAFEAEDFFPHFNNGGAWVFFTAALLRDHDGKIIGAIETLQDITARRQAELALHREQARMAAIINGSSVPTFVIDKHHTITHLNRAYEILMDVSAKDMIGTNRQWHPAYPAPRPVLADLLLDEAPPEKFAELHEHCRPSRLVPGAVEAETFIPTLGSQGRWLYQTAAPITDDKGVVVGVLETLQDISERKQAEIALQKSEERYRQLSTTDSLTGLGNLRSCYEYLEREMARSRRYSSPLSVLLFDVDNFKEYNDTWGHMEGDAALKALAGCVQGKLRVSDSAFRYGGEEFVIILPETTLDQAEILAERIRIDYAGTLLTPAENVAVSCTVSIGITQFRQEDTAKSFLNRADSGTYQAKADGKNRVVLMA
jgi:diguanylate cyclase (GGDEF)-like protein/PAS domain S-box-containing protein